MVKHPDYIVGFDGSLDDFVEVFFETSLGNQTVFMEESSKDFNRQSEADFNRPSYKNPEKNRSKLACVLFYAHQELITTAELMRKINSTNITQELDLFQTEIVEGLSIQQLVFNVNNMRYDFVSKLYKGLEYGFQKRGDFKQLHGMSFSEASKFYNVADSLEKTVRHINEAWRHSKDYM